MRHLSTSLILMAALALPAMAQPRPPAKGGPPPQAAPQPPAPLPGFFPCRSEAEICYVGVVTGPSQVAVLYTNNRESQGIDAKPVEVFQGEAPGTALPLGDKLGRVVMLTGSYAAATGLSRAEVVDVASPLLTFTIKASLGGEEGGGAPPAAAKGGAPKRR